MKLKQMESVEMNKGHINIFLSGKGKPGFIPFVQTFDYLINFHLHIHVLAADGVFSPNCIFRVLPSLPKVQLMQAFREAVIAALIVDDAITGECGAYQRSRRTI